jgi:hypothetical protein
LRARLVVVGKELTMSIHPNDDPTPPHQVSLDATRC